MNKNPSDPFLRLRIYNAIMVFLHAIQGIIILALANDFALPVVGTFMDGPPGVGDAKITTLFEVSLAWGVAIFLFMSALAHLAIILPGVFGWYRNNLLKGRNYARWIEYSLSSSLMVVLIAMLTGIADIAALGAIFGVNAGMILFGLLMEHYEQPGAPNWMAYIFGSIIGLVPWAVVGVYLWSPGIEASPPVFVYVIYVSLFVFFNSFALNMVFQYARIGPWKNYLVGESTYILLSLVAKSALAWQVFGGTLAI